MSSSQRRVGLRVRAIVVAAAAALGAASAQTPLQAPTGPVDPGNVTAAPQDAAAAIPAAPQAGTARTSMRDVFAGTLAAVLQASGSTLALGLAQAVTGGLTGWFGRKLNPRSGPSAEAAAAPVTPVAPVPPDSSAVAADVPLVAGLAFEVHALGANGASVPVDPATHQFRTGDRFVVYFRPALPGYMDVYNVNAAGIVTHIDSLELAAAQLTRLGPYEFAALTGDEQLRLVLSPCSTPALVGATRDIVKVPDAVPTSPGLAIHSCAGPVTRSLSDVPTRDIRKVAVEGNTGFALDPLSPDELASGQLATREVTIRFQHR
jgi:hypothetical protein